MSAFGTGYHRTMKLAGAQTLCPCNACAMQKQAGAFKNFTTGLKNMFGKSTREQDDVVRAVFDMQKLRQMATDAPGPTPRILDRAKANYMRKLEEVDPQYRQAFDRLQQEGYNATAMGNNLPRPSKHIPLSLKDLEGYSGVRGSHPGSRKWMSDLHAEKNQFTGYGESGRQSSQALNRLRQKSDIETRQRAVTSAGA